MTVSRTSLSASPHFGSSQALAAPQTRFGAQSDPLADTVDYIPGVAQNPASNFDVIPPRKIPTRFLDTTSMPVRDQKLQIAAMLINSARNRDRLAAAESVIERIAELNGQPSSNANDSKSRAAATAMLLHLLGDHAADVRQGIIKKVGPGETDLGDQRLMQTIWASGALDQDAKVRLAVAQHAIIDNPEYPVGRDSVDALTKDKEVAVQETAKARLGTS